MQQFRLMLAAVIVLGLASAAWAGPLVQKLPKVNPDPNRGFQSEVGIGALADDFKLGAAATVGQVSWWGYLSGTVNSELFARDFLISIYSDSAGVPDSLLRTTNVSVAGVLTADTSAGPGAPPEPLYKYTANINPIALAANTQYWLLIAEDEPGGIGWLWQSAGRPAGSPGLNILTPSGAWDTRASISGETQVAFELAEPVPEPGTIALLGTGLAVLIWRRRRRA